MYSTGLFRKLGRGQFWAVQRNTWDPSGAIITPSPSGVVMSTPYWLEHTNPVNTCPVYQEPSSAARPYQMQGSPAPSVPSWSSR